MLSWRNQWLRPARGSADTKQRLYLQGYLIVNKCCQEERNPLLPRHSGLGCFVSTAGAVAGAAQAGEIQKAPSQVYFYSYRSSRKRGLVLSPCLTCQGFKHPAKFLTTSQSFLLSVCLNFTCFNSRCSAGPSALLWSQSKVRQPRRRRRRRASLLGSWCQIAAEQPRGPSRTCTPLLLPAAPKRRGMLYPRQSVCEGVRHF